MSARTEEEIERAFVLLKAMNDILDKAAESRVVENVFELTAIWDDAECDGGCWHEECKALLEGGES